MVNWLLEGQNFCNILPHNINCGGIYDNDWMSNNGCIQLNDKNLHDDTDMNKDRTLTPGLNIA